MDLADPIWTVEHVAAAVRPSERATRALVARHGVVDPDAAALAELAALPTTTRATR